MKTHGKNKQTAWSARKREGVANAFDFVHCTWLVESVARVFSYSINVEKEKPKQRRITFKALFDWGSLDQNQSNCNQKKGKFPEEPKRTNSKPLKARENAGGQVAIGVNFSSDWFREWREFCGPITEQSKAKAMQSRTTFDTQSKIAPYESFLVYVIICNLFSNIV